MIEYIKVIFGNPISLAVLGGSCNVAYSMLDKKEVSYKDYCLRMFISFSTGILILAGLLPNNLNSFVLGYAAPDAKDFLTFLKERAIK